jgi:hypothetical protein
VPGIDPLRIENGVADYLHEDFIPGPASPKRIANFPKSALLDRQAMNNGKAAERKKFMVVGTPGTTFLTFYTIEGLADGLY